jgi:hypothetical protein
MMRRLVALVALLEVTLAIEFFKNIPKLYLSAQDLSPAYIDFSKYFDMTRTVNPMLSTSTPEAITLIQPFQNFTVATPAKIEETMGGSEWDWSCCDSLSTTVLLLAHLPQNTLWLYATMSFSYFLSIPPSLGPH